LTGTYPSATARRAPTRKDGKLIDRIAAGAPLGRLLLAGALGLARVPWSRAACARAVTAYALPYSSTTSLPGGQIRAERYDRGIANVFAVQDEITEAIVAAIKPQLYARESFRPNASRRTAWMLGIW
jgi:hypothetical protein